MKKRKNNLEILKAQYVVRRTPLGSYKFFLIKKPKQ